MSEGDNLQYIQERMLHIWRDPQRGTIPIGWPHGRHPGAKQRQQCGTTYLDTASANDEFYRRGPVVWPYSYPSKWPQKQTYQLLATDRSSYANECT